MNKYIAKKKSESIESYAKRIINAGISVPKKKGETLKSDSYLLRAIHANQKLKEQQQEKKEKKVQKARETREKRQSAKPKKLIKKEKTKEEEYDLTIEYTFDRIKNLSHAHSETGVRKVSTYTYTSKAKPTLAKVRSWLEEKITNENMYGNYPPENVKLNDKSFKVVLVQKKTTEDIKQRRMKYSQLHYDGKGVTNPNAIIQDGNCVLTTLVGLGFDEKYIYNYFDNKLKAKGVSVEDGINSYELLDFCVDHRMSMYAMDLLDNNLIRYVPKNADHHKKALMYISANGHIYEITDVARRCAIKNETSGKIIVSSVLSTKKEKTIPKKKGHSELAPLPQVRDLDYERKQEHDEQPYYTIISPQCIEDLEALPEKASYYLPESKVDLMKIFYYIAMEDGTIPISKEVNRRMSMVKWNRKQITFYFNEHIDECLRMCKVLEVQFQNQSLASLCRKFLAEYNVTFDMCKSELTNETRELFSSSLAKSSGFIQNFVSMTAEELEGKYLASYDRVKCYSHILEKYGLPVYDGLCSVQPYSGELKAGFYYVETENVLPFKGNGLYVMTEVSEGLKDKIISPSDIKYEVVASSICDKFQKIVKPIYEKYGNDIGKIVINCIIGSIGMKDSFITNSVYVNNTIDAMYYRFLSDTQIQVMSKDMFKVLQQKELMFTSTGRPAFLAIVQTGNMLLYRMHKMLTKAMPRAICLQVKIDAVHFMMPNKKERIYKAKTKKEAKIGDYRKETPLSKTIHKTKIEKLRRTERYEKKPMNWKIQTFGQWNPSNVGEDVYKKFPNGCVILGDAGTGKSEMLYALYDYLYHLCNGKIAKIALTNTAAMKIEGKTIHRFFRIGIDTNATIMPKTIYNIIKNCKYVLVDEISMIPMHLYKYLNLIKMHGVIIYMAGDFKQLKPVHEEHIEFESSPMLFDLVEGNKLQLTHNYRANQSFAECCSKGEYDMNMFKRSANQSGYDKLNICYHNDVREKINKECEKIYGKMGSIGSRIIVEKNVTVEKQFFANGDIFEVVGKNKIKRLFGKKADELTVNLKELLNYCELAYCITTHKSQGLTIKEPYTIYEFLSMYKEMRYTALTRTSNPDLVRIAGVQEGYIYKLTDGAEVYIGSTFNTKKRFDEHIRDSYDGTSKLYKYMRTTDLDKWTMEVIDKPLILDKFNGKGKIEQIRTYEDEYVLRYDSINKGLNERRAQRDIGNKKVVKEIEVKVTEEEKKMISLCLPNKVYFQKFTNGTDVCYTTRYDSIYTLNDFIRLRPGNEHLQHFASNELINWTHKIIAVINYRREIRNFNIAITQNLNRYATRRVSGTNYTYVDYF